MWAVIMSAKSFCSPESKIQTARTGLSESLERCIYSFYYSKIAGVGKNIKQRCMHFIGINLYFI